MTIAVLGRCGEGRINIAFQRDSPIISEGRELAAVGTWGPKGQLHVALARTEMNLFSPFAGSCSSYKFPCSLFFNHSSDFCREMAV